MGSERIYLVGKKYVYITGGEPGWTMVSGIAPRSGRSGNVKMGDSGLLTCFEVEQLKPCKFFFTGTCKSCYAEKLLKMRRKTSRHIHKATPGIGLIRLGTYKEVTEEDWLAFKAGKGTWDCCGAEWVRADFPQRKYFLITRGLEPLSFYEKVLDDPDCVNVQVSTDIYPELDGATLPEEGRLAWFATHDKVVFRFKTMAENHLAFLGLAERLGLTGERRKWIMETPLRQADAPHAYGTTTFLERAGWDPRTFGRCNTSCEDCVKENGMLLCGATPTSLAKVAKPLPPRMTYAGGVSPEVQMMQLKGHWRDLTVGWMRENGGRATLSTLYQAAIRDFPVLAKGKPGYALKIRQNVQKVGVQVGRGEWELAGQYARVTIPLEAAMPTNTTPRRRHAA